MHSYYWEYIHGCEDWTLKCVQVPLELLSEKTKRIELTNISVWLCEVRTTGP